MQQARPHPVFAEIDSWYQRAPAGLNENEIMHWVQRNHEIPCPVCAEPLFVLKTRRSRNRGFSHLAMCERPTCSFQVDD